MQQSININIDFTTGNEAIGGHSKVWAKNKQLYIIPESDDIAYIYNAAGMAIKSISVSDGETTGIPLPAGLYIVKLNNNTYKVVIK